METQFYYLVLILLVSDISSNAFTANERKLKGISSIITHMTLFKNLHEKKGSEIKVIKTKVLEKVVSSKIQTALYLCRLYIKQKNLETVA